MTIAQEHRFSLIHIPCSNIEVVYSGGFMGLQNKERHKSMQVSNALVDAIKEAVTSKWENLP